MKNFSGTHRIERALERLAKVLFSAYGSQRGIGELSESVRYEPLYEIRGALDLDETNRLIADLIGSTDPFFVGRFGSTELRAVVRTIMRRERSIEERLFAFLARLEPPFWVSTQYRNLESQSGFFPITKEAIDDFVELMLESAGKVDLLASWVPGENKIDSFISAEFVTRLDHLEPFFAHTPWTSALRDMKVLVIHPFADTIQRQFGENRHLLFSRPEILPNFELICMQAEQSLDPAERNYETWELGLASMLNKAEKIDFDIAIVGCGAYGFPLSAQIKSWGKKVVHLGGVTQLLFGIRGRRWDKKEPYQQLFNQFWVRPDDSEKPAIYKRVDRGVYW